ncbi:hypothetical protein AUK41_03530 [Candidatus Berkelbacteria bacterium CG2_30_43_20]|nr:MAG: hypothetical protein AUK41_03530 [Candidatus Berkelbacteria bacterium CG2_30_43_20]
MNKELENESKTQTSYLQTQSWATFKSAFGWKADTVGDVFVLSRQLPYINQLMMYVPEVMIHDSSLLEKLVLFAKEKKPMFLRLEILNNVDGGNAEAIKQKLKENHFVKAFEELQPEHRQIIDLTQSETDILHNMKEKGRYNTRLAQKKGVRVEITTGDDATALEKLKIVYDLYQKTADRKSISGRSYSYFEKLLENFKDEIILSIAYTPATTSPPSVIAVPPSVIARSTATKQSITSTPLAGSITLIHGGVASYLYGGSSLERKELMAPYLLHYEVMKYAKTQNCQTYDLLAIAPPDQPNHKFANLTRFKQQFGGKSIARLGSYDLKMRPFWYTIFKLLENIRRK